MTENSLQTEPTAHNATDCTFANPSSETNQDCTSTDSVTDDVTDAYHTTKAVTDINEDTIELSYYGYDTKSRAEQLYFTIISDTDIIEHDYVTITPQSLYRQILSSGTEWPANPLATICNALLTATDITHTTHGGSVTLHTDQLPAPLHCRLDKWKPNTRVKSSGESPHTGTNQTQHSPVHHPGATGTSLYRDVQLCNALTLTSTARLPVTIKEPTSSTNHRVTYPVEFTAPTERSETDPITVEFTFKLPDAKPTGTQLPFETLVDYAGGSPEFIPGTELELAPLWTNNSVDPITHSGTGTDGDWGICIPIEHQSLLTRLKHRIPLL